MKRSKLATRHPFYVEISPGCWQFISAYSRSHAREILLGPNPAKVRTPHEMEMVSKYGERRWFGNEMEELS